MGKMIGVTEFKAKCLRILDELERTREPITITKRGRVIGELHPPSMGKKKFGFGFLAHPAYRFDDPEEPAVDPSEVHANDPSKWDDLL